MTEPRTPEPSGARPDAERKPADDPKAAGEREALKESEKRAAREQPGNFKDRENEDKIVEVGGDRTGDAIKGLDPDR